ncbi:Rha family transcriptional regulator [Sporomusa sphaeroides DSM 2875]|uniref:Rha family transcriptional regulator n=1 Tax=Sporomusa sphaeroides TaxID=47679 RepID=UPI0020300CBE|nr:Rha family transcriptional regulator [Sporomusa sphaeroides]MCM0758516.1 Rha family transcriptional regulator [Sporomusa sphaeroides DSM 2875]
MNNLVIINSGQAVVSSRQVAENFGKEHSKVIRSIEGILAESGNATFGDTKLFYKSAYEDQWNRTQAEYLMNRDGFTLLAMGFTGSKALEWKLKYIQAFNEMEKQLASPFVIPQTFAEALQLAATQALQIEQLQPKGEYYDRNNTPAMSTKGLGESTTPLDIPRRFINTVALTLNTPMERILESQSNHTENPSALESVDFVRVVSFDLTPTIAQISYSR